MTIDVISFAKKLIACPSITPDEGGALTVMEKALSEIGFSCDRMIFMEEGTPDVENLYAKYGKEQPNLCFAGHTDVVPPGNEADWSVPPFSPAVKDAMLYGRGTVDMKGAVACFVSAVSQVIDEQDGEIPGSISFLITGDEEAVAINGTRKMLPWLKENNEELTDCIVGEPTNPKNLGDMIKIGRRGSVCFAVTVKGVQGHVAYPDLAKNPCPVLNRLLHEVSSRRLDEGTQHFQPSNLEVTTIDVGNSADNVIPQEATAMFNIRFNDQHNSSGLIEWVEGIRQAILTEERNIEIDIITRLSGESFLTAPGKLSDLVAGAVEEVTGRKPELSTSGGTSDARFIKDVCPVVECGLINQTAHKVDERVAVADLENLTVIYKKVIERYFGL